MAVTFGLTRPPAETHWSKEATVRASGKWQYLLPEGSGGGGSGKWGGCLTECLRADVTLEGVSSEAQRTKSESHCAVCSGNTRRVLNNVGGPLSGRGDQQIAKH